MSTILQGWHPQRDKGNTMKIRWILGAALLATWVGAAAAKEAVPAKKIIFSIPESAKEYPA